MTILSIDTSTPHASVAVTKNSQVLSQTSFSDPKTFSRTLLARVHACLDSIARSLDTVDAFAVARGPGSFTGLRLGISMITGFSLATGKPAAGIDTLHAMAMTAPRREGLICPLLDARKDQVYGAVFQYQNGTLRRTSEDTAEIPEAFLRKISGRSLFFGPGAERYGGEIRSLLKDKADFPLEAFRRTTAAAVGLMAGEIFKKSGKRGDQGITPRYVRPSDAEISRESKHPI